MEQFEELQALWTTQQVAGRSGQAAPALAARLKWFARREVSIAVTKMAVVAAVVIPAMWWLLRHTTSPLVIAGALWSAAAVAVVVALQWRQQDALARLDYAAASAEFVHAALHALERHQAAAVTCARGLTAALIVGLNAMALGSARGEDGWPPVASHLACTILPLAAYAVGIRVRRRRAAAACDPLRRHLEEIRDRG